MLLRVFITTLLFFITREGETQRPYLSDSIQHQIKYLGEQDQKDRSHIDSLQKADPFNSDLINPAWKEVARNDSIRSVNLYKIFRDYDLEKKFFDDELLLSVFVIIQHSNNVYLAKFMDVLKKHVDNGNYPKDYYAMHIDRLAMQTDKYQVYGTQLGGDYTGKLKIWPIKEVLQVNDRRKEMGLASIEAYAKQYDLAFASPSIDSFKNKVIVEGIIANKKDNSAIYPVTIYARNMTKVGCVNKDGAFSIVIPRRTLKKGLYFFSNYYNITPVYKYAESIDVYFLYFKTGRK